jgi:hypothetical protein
MKSITLSLFLFAAAAVPAFAEPVSNDTLKETRLTCLRSAGAKPGAVTYCNCLAEQASKNLTSAQFTSMERRLSELTAKGASGDQMAVQIPEYGKLVRACGRETSDRIQAN